jgi:vanillate O-demethylase ferredoxin subunit
MSGATAPLRVRVEAIRREADGIASYELVSPDGSALPAFSAGAHIDLHLPQALVRSYSLVNAPGETHRYLIAVYRDEASRGGSSWMHQVPRVGDLLSISPPKNDFPLVENAAYSILIAGGIGITPLAAMASRLQQLGRPWRLHYAARSKAQAAFADALGALAERPGGALHLHFSDQQPGRLDVARIVREAPANAHLYCCGPAGMIDAFLEAGKARPPGFIHCERFAATQEAATDGGYEVVLARQGRSFVVAPGKTILDTLLDNGIDALYSCSQGVCGTCMTNVIEGEPDHRDDYLTAEEKAANHAIMICCSGARSPRLVLDL